MGSDLFGDPKPNGGITLKSALTVRLTRWLSRHVDAVIVKSKSLRELTPLTNVTVIPNGVDFELFRPIPRAEARAALGWDPDRYYVLFGNNPAIPRKAFSVAEAALTCLRCRGILAELVVAWELPHSTVAWYINASNALLLPSMDEGSPNIVKEAMACDVPVVATDVGDVAEVLGHTKGCSVCPRDPEALATGLERALLHSAPTTGRKDILHLDRRVVARQVIAVYEQVIQVRRRAPHRS
jgi:glycosyltransferase involved in cell wall biosynthesis